MNQDQWNGGMKELKGILKKRWGKLTRNSLLEAMGELERLLGVFQRQYGYLKARELRENRQDVPHVPPDWTRARTLVLCPDPWKQAFTTCFPSNQVKFSSTGTELKGAGS